MVARTLFWTASLLVTTSSWSFLSPRRPRQQTCHSQLSLSAAAQEAPSGPPNLVSQEAFIKAIDVLKVDMGMEVIPDDQRPMYALGKLEAQLPLEQVSGLQSLDTIVAIRAGDSLDFVTNGMEIAKVAEAYTAAINFAVENGLSEIQLEVNRLVPMMPSADD
ncbi:hypothetical protein THAOC_02805 [Thalassiosira oceanica]|uniref:Uncharacterized protein n=1 Tax=Thalassiosira oceanica TaxID=159749 RepID=K0T9N8_THAOC|nr:hypothetical protein THAOC_02805 [Thalassiosira oceanica]|eukprot:EJK75473.1 hypothetical protein THAOC_02805 [Thalassiosira oceanica]